MLPDPGFLYLSKKHQAALTLLEYGLLNHIGFCVISGEAGSGKTTILRALLERVEDDVTVGLITNTHQSFGGLLDWVLSVFDLHRANLTQVEMHQIFMEFLIEQYGKGRTVLLIVDEAQNMKADALEELRMLSNVNSEKDQLMQVMLAGQPALKETLRLPALMQFAQRIGVDYHLDVLGLKETCGYIQHRLMVAGAKKDIFTPAACERIHNYSGGTPRLINLLCETVLVYGYADQQELIDVELVEEMVLERMQDSVVPIVNRDLKKQNTAEVNAALEKEFPWISSQNDREVLALKEATAAPKGKAESVVTGEVEKKPVENVVTLESEKTAIKTAPAVNKQSGKTQKIPVKPPVLAQVEQTTPPVVNADKKTVKANRTDAGTGSTETGRKVVAKKPVAETIQAEKQNSTKKQWFKNTGIAIILALILIAGAIMLSNEEFVMIKIAIENTAMEDTAIEDSAKAAAAESALQLKHKQDEKHLRQLQHEAEILKEERDAALAKAEQEKQAKLEAEKLAAEKAATAAKATAEKQQLAERQRVAAAKERERRGKQAQARAKQEANRARLEAAKLAEQKQVMQLRLDEQRRLKEHEEARRMELERQEKQRLRWLADEQEAKRLAAEEAAKKAKAKPTECAGSAARFKGACR